ncbi:hypothetical protein AHiyo6_34040 [Arthrobacter sp. Hiyo6]|jgi:hypothetical protein|nr:hypothetical protein AHiyo6_34040 [Arthrobacter sp. Hiyo6]
MNAFTVGRFCRSLGALSLAGGITQNVGRREPVRCPKFASGDTNRVPSTGSAVGVAACAERRNGRVDNVHRMGFGSGRT